MFLELSYFCPKHIIILVICVIFIVLAGIFSKKLKLETVYKILLGTGIVSETIKVFYFIMTNEDTLHGYLPKTDLPFHLCSIQIIFIVILNLSKNEKLKKLLQAFMLPTCLVGGIAAMLLPTYSSLNGLWIITLQYFGYHAVITAFSIYMFRTKEIEFTFDDYKHCLIMLASIGIIAIYVNSIIQVGDFDSNGWGKVNFMYVVHSVDESLPFLNSSHGWVVYIIHYASLAFIVITLTFIKPIIAKFRRKDGSRDRIEVQGEQDSVTVQ